MKATSIKQIKFNRGQVSDLLSERVDMGLQNACGTVYDNTYINRYGQLENAPSIKIASNGVKNNEVSVLTLFDTGTDIVIPIAVDYSAGTINYYGWLTTPFITVDVTARATTSLHTTKTVSKTCSRAPGKDYTSGGVNYYAWNFNAEIKIKEFSTSAPSGYNTYYLKIDYVYTTSLNPSVGDPITAHVSASSWGIDVYSTAITNVSGRATVYTKVLIPTSADGVYDTSLLYIGRAYTSTATELVFDGVKYYRTESLDTSQGTTKKIAIYSPLSKSDNTITTDLSTPVSTKVITGEVPSKAYQFGYNVVLYDQFTKPILLNIVEGTNGWANATLTVKEDYFTDAFNQIFIRGKDIETPTGFTIPTTGNYTVVNQTSITTSKIVEVTGSGFTQSLVGQVIQSSGNGGALQVRSVESATKLYAYVLSPLTVLKSTDSQILIPWNSAIVAGRTMYNGDSAKWIFGYVNPFGDTASPTGTPSYPDSVIFVNQRLVFGGNDYFGNVICASRIGVLNDFDPESATESDAFTTSIASKDFCRIIDFVVSNNELRIACTNGEYAMSLGALTPTGSLNGFDLRSEVGIAKDTPICDCGGVTAYVSNDRNAVYGTQFSLLKDRYQPISLTSQTDNIVNNCIQLVYLKNRYNNEGNLLVGLNADGTLFGSVLDTNSGLVGLFKMNGYGLEIPNISLKVTKLFCAGWSLWALIDIVDITNPAEYKQYIVRFARSEFFNFPCGLTLPTDIAQFIGQDGIYFRGLISAGDSFDVLEPTDITDNGDGTSTITFGDDNDPLLFVAGFFRQYDWRSVEIGLGMATRELNKSIIKMSAVIKPQEFWNWAHTDTETVSAADFGKFFNLTRSATVETRTSPFVVTEPLDIYNENGTMIWRRAFDNPTREKFYGFTAIAPFLVKSLTAVVQYDEVA